MKIRSLVLVGVVLAAAPAWGAEGPATLDKHVTAINRTARTPEGQQVVVQRLSQELGIPTKTLWDQRQRTGFGWGQILIANRIAQRTGMTFDQVVSEFRGGKGFGVIARERDLNVGKLVSEVKASDAAIRASVSSAGHGRARGEDAGVTSGANGTGAGGHAAGGAPGHGWGRGEGMGVTSGAGSAGHAAGGLGFGVRGGGRR